MDRIADVASLLVVIAVLGVIGKTASWKHAECSGHFKKGLLVACNGNKGAMIERM